jgi:hypothetical protein
MAQCGVAASSAALAASAWRNIRNGIGENGGSRRNGAMTAKWHGGMA